MLLIRNILLFPLKLIFGFIWLHLNLFNLLVKLVVKLDHWIIDIILLVFTLIMMAYYVLVTPGRMDTNVLYILLGAVVAFLISRLLVLIPDVLARLIGFCNRVLQL